MHPYRQQQQQNYISPSALQPRVPVSPALPQAYLRTQQQLQPSAQAQAWQQHPQYGVVPRNSSVQGYDSGSVGGLAWRQR
jgi:hypothetical protein